MTSFVDGNQIRLLRNGTEYFPALEAAIDASTIEIYLQTYIYEPDITGVRIADALKRAAMRGVEVNLLLDGFGCKDLPKPFIKAMEDAGVRIVIYRPKISPWTLKSRRLRRLHRKVAVIDRSIGFVGGINIIDDHNTPDQVPPRIDYAVEIVGPLLRDMLVSTRKLWHRIAWKRFGLSNTERTFNPSKAMSKGVRAAFVLRDNVLHRRDIENAYLTAIDAAESEILIANAYFVPGRRFRKALYQAAQRGVKVTLLLQGRKEYFLMFATHAFYNEFLNAGIEIFEYRKSFMHSKVAVIDGVWATVGSSNIDPLSLLLAYEANVVVKDAQFSNQLREEINHSIQNGSHRVTEYEWKRGLTMTHVASWIAYGLVRAFLGIIGDSTN